MLGRGGECTSRGSRTLQRDPNGGATRCRLYGVTPQSSAHATGLDLQSLSRSDKFSEQTSTTPTSAPPSRSHRSRGESSAFRPESKLEPKPCWSRDEFWKEYRRHPTVEWWSAAAGWNQKSHLS
ncbi:hypothetical protein FQA47_021559 [Oryzias melastigma]|uniref:Uncharacterized protein n=1 Tax=Oryzias melastigma TaxID=30732 RepID=A0A834BU60_ORYME|nr:hypothetical protein FQA47_021559 [Oryzias melastigma]